MRVEKSEGERGIQNVLRALPVGTATGTRIEVSTMFAVPVYGEIWGLWEKGEVIEVVYGPKPQGSVHAN